ncbi:hypothetical protein I3760_06G043700 [Carya illinoinensis]|uniref:EF-hand domain-containing protein n=2 Tax=Carya illinoinensis TaxID=32201 RepID=A0A922ETL7_CARIL|nr:reticulocalbin-2 [Carya illinoinensis]KAG2701415.1 hypothetical protein I3760_06G043700 [Carya illinoinensis]KAG6707688.1 hypothetical protein I3842_06G044400 [Carya illinoinensis]
MAKTVFCTLLAIAFIVLIIMVFSPASQQGQDRPGALHRRLGHNFSVSTFDPLVAKIERLAEKNELGGPVNPLILKDDSLAEEVAEAREYFSEGKLNVTLRLMVLFPFLDTAPNDGVVSFKELEGWIAQQAHDRLNYRTEKELALRDKDGDGAISFREYLPHFSNEDIEKNGMEHGEAGWWKVQLENADADQNGSLSFDEFKDFLHPEDSSNEKVKNWILTEKIKLMDQDGDWKLSFPEFLEQAHDILKNYVDFETAGAHVPTAEENFAMLDVDNDKFLAVEELKPILHYLHPGELSYAKYYSSHLIRQADDNKDGNLSLDEMLNHDHIFYNTVYDESNEDLDEDYHDEL